MIFTQNQTNSHISELDWHQYSCQCPCHPCPHNAEYVIEIHAINQCNQPQLKNGNRIQLRCARCTSNLWAIVIDDLAALNQYGVATCTCGAPITTPGDVIRSVKPLRTDEWAY